MFNNQTPVPPTELELVITKLTESLMNEKPDSPEFAAMVVQLDKLYKMKTYKKESSINPEVLLTVAGNLVGILIIISYERVNVMTSKALSFVLKSRV